MENFFCSEKLNCISLLEYLPIKVVVRVMMGGVFLLFLKHFDFLPCVQGSLVAVCAHDDLKATTVELYLKLALRQE